jgi:hypothetical protein
MSPRSRILPSTTGSFSILCDRRRDQVARRHQRGYGLLELRLEAQIAVREDADQHTGRIGDRHTRDLVALHQRERVPHERVGRERDRLDDHSGLGALDLVDLGHLLLDRQVAVHDPDPALPGERDREARLRDGVHRRRDDGDAELDRPRQPRARRHVVRQHARLRGDEQHVVEREALLGELPVQVEQALQLVWTEIDAQGKSMVPPCPDAPGGRDPARTPS